MAGSYIWAFVMAATAAAAGQHDASEKSADPMDKVICKRFLETGSLVKGTRICKSKREWEAERDATRSALTQPGACNTGGGGGAC